MPVFKVLYFWCVLAFRRYFWLFGFSAVYISGLHFWFFGFFGFRRIKLLATFAESKHRKWGTVIILGHSTHGCPT